jgi:acyl-CoA thioester hydrolase
MNEKNIIPKHIYYHDTDCGGVVYYANYLKYFEEARTEYMRERGLELKDLAQKGFLFVVKKVDIDYKAPAAYADNLEIESKIIRVKNVSLEFLQEVRRQNKVLVSASTILVCIDANFRPVPIPQEIIEIFQDDHPKSN